MRCYRRVSPWAAATKRRQTGPLVNSSEMIRPRPGLLSTLAFAALVTAFAHGQGTHLWTQSTAVEYERGTPDGVAISSLGRLTPAPSAKTVLTTGSTYVWSLTADKAGNAYLATGSPAGVLRVTPAGVQTRLFATKELAVQVVRVGPDGALYAALLPSGRVLRLDPAAADQDESRATVVFDPAQLPTSSKPKYVWDLAFDAQGRLYVATGAPGAIYRVPLAKGAPGKPEPFYASDEPHIRTLAFDTGGTLYAGSDGTGLVYRITPDGKGFVVFEAAKREITALTFSPRGSLYVAAVGERGRSPLPPLPVQGISSVTATITVVQPGSVQAFNNNTVIPEGSDIYEIPVRAGGAPHRIWSSHDDIVYALQANDAGLLAATGNRGHLYQIAEDGTASDLAHLFASQVTGFATSPAGLYAATANTGKLYLLGSGATREAAGEHSFESEVFDAQVQAAWGRVETLGTGQYKLYARTGNVENPVRAWTDWKPVTGNQGEPGLTPARYVQWKAVLEPSATINSVGVNYLPANLAPVVDEVVVVPGARVNAQANMPQVPQSVSINFGAQQASQGYEQNAGPGPLSAIRDKSAVTARWAAHDDNGDELSFSLYYRAEGGADTAWRLLKDKITERFYTFDASLLPDGAYRMQVVASDAPSHAAAEALTGKRESAGFLIDTATPQVTALAATAAAGGVHVTATAIDQSTPIARAEYSMDAGPWQYVEPVGRLSDSLTEHYDFTAPISPGAAQGSPHSVTLRVFDRYDNSGSAKATSAR